MQIDYSYAESESANNEDNAHLDIDDNSDELEETDSISRFNNDLPIVVKPTWMQPLSQ